MNAKTLEAIFLEAADALIKFGRESSSDLVDSIAQCAEEASLQETKPKFGINFKITLDLEKNFCTFEESFGVRRKLSATIATPDPEQLKLSIPRN